MKAVLLLRLGVLACGALTPRATSAQSAPSIVVVVNAANPVSTLTKHQVSDLFLKQTIVWPSGEPVVPVDQDRNAKIRDAFSRVVHGRMTSAVVTYWQMQVFSGRNAPPVTKAGDLEILAFVRATPNAIGYVNAETPLGANVKVVTVGGL